MGKARIFDFTKAAIRYFIQNDKTRKYFNTSFYYPARPRGFRMF